MHVSHELHCLVKSTGWVQDFENVNLPYFLCELISASRIACGNIPFFFQTTNLHEF